MAYASCPCCSAESFTQSEYGSQIRRCTECGAIYGSCYLGDSYGIVKPRFGGSEASQIYFDLACLGSTGITRRHGWFDPETHLLTQVG